MKKSIIFFFVFVLFVGGVAATFAAEDDKGPVGSAMVTVPNVLGKTLVEAISLLRNSGFIPETQVSDREAKGASSSDRILPPVQKRLRGQR